MEEEQPFPKQTLSLRKLRDKALRELLPRMVDDIMHTGEADLEQYHYLIECHLQNWVNGQEMQVVDEWGRDVANVPAAIVKEIWSVKNG